MAIFDTGGVITIERAAIDLTKFSTLNKEQREELRNVRSTLKTDLFMFAEGDLFPDERASDKTDLRIVSGIYNFAQQITHRLMTDRGTHPQDPAFGVPWSNYIGQTYLNSQSIISNLNQDITDELYKDSRTQRVVFVKGEFVSPNVISVECAIEPIGFRGTDFGIALTLGELV